MIEYWRKGHVPGKVSDIEILAREIVRRGGLSRSWLQDFLRSADYPWLQQLCDDLFPPSLSQLPDSPETQLLLPDSEPTYKFATLPINYIPNPAPLPKGSLMPWSKNPHFVGRESDLLALAAAFKATKTISISQVDTAIATGLGGIGKTQLASEFVHRYGQFFDGGIYWLSFDNPQAISSEIASCGDIGAMELRSDFSARSISDQVKLVLAAWQSPIPRLLVFDNCEDPDLLVQWRPTSGGCRVLVTSRRGDWEGVLDVQNLALGVLSRTKSIELLAKHCPDIKRTILDKIAEELGDLPLALHLAGRYLHYYRRALDPTDYLKQLRDPNLLKHPSMQGDGISPTGHAQHVGRTFALSYDQLDTSDENDALARKMLVHAAHFAPGEPIWYALLVKTVNVGIKKSGAALLAERAFQRLIDVGLIETEGRDILRLHRLVAKFVRDVAMDEVEATQKAVEAVVFEETKQMNKDVQPLPLLSWQLHLRSVVDIAKARNDSESARLCNELGQHLWQISDFSGALLYHKKALEIRLGLFGELHQETAESLIGVGRQLRGLGKDKESQSYFERSLKIRETLFGKFHVDTAESYENLGRCLYALGNLSEGLVYIETALEIVQAVLGSENALAAEYHNNIALCFYGMGKFDDALEQFKQALAINENVLGSEHPHTALNFHNLGSVLCRVGKYSEAQPYLERALEIRQIAYGDDHKDTAISVNALANLYYELDQLAEAQQLAEVALDKFKAILGEDHVRTSYGHRTLGQILQKQGDMAAAKSHLQRAYDIRLATRGHDHFLTEEVRADLDNLNS